MLVSFYEKGKDGSYFHNNLLKRRDGEKAPQLFSNNDETISAFLNGYAIIPIEEYARLVEMASPSDARLKPVIFSMKDIKEANKQLYNQEGE